MPSIHEVVLIGGGHNGLVAQIGSIETVADVVAEQTTHV
jgi:hypothetical protein